RKSITANGTTRLGWKHGWQCCSGYTASAGRMSSGSLAGCNNNLKKEDFMTNSSSRALGGMKWTEIAGLAIVLALTAGSQHALAVQPAQYPTAGTVTSRRSSEELEVMKHLLDRAVNKAIQGLPDDPHVRAQPDGWKNKVGNKEA